MRSSQIEGRVVKKRGTLLESLANKKGTPEIKIKREKKPTKRERVVKVKAEPVNAVPRSEDGGSEGPFPGFSRPYEEVRAARPGLSPWGQLSSYRVVVAD